MSPQVARLRINLNTLVVIEPKISPCGRDDRIVKPSIVKNSLGLSAIRNLADSCFAAYFVHDLRGYLFTPLCPGFQNGKHVAGLVFKGCGALLNGAEFLQYVFVEYFFTLNAADLRSFALPWLSAAGVPAE